MNTILYSVGKYLRPVAIPLWAFFLMLPFTGPAKALAIAAVAGCGFVLWRLMKTDAVRSFAGTVLSLSDRIKGRVVVDVPANLKSALLYFILLALIVVPIFLSDYERDVMTLACMYAVLALGLNIIVGQAGLLNLGYVAFYAVGAYTYAILNTRFGLPFWPGLVAGAVASSFFAALIGLVTLRLRGDYFAIVTLGLGEITRIVLNNWTSMTGGQNGLSNISRPILAGHVFSTPLEFYYLIFGMGLITVFSVRRLMSSRIGRAWSAIREDELAAEAMGINTFRMKMLASVLGSAFAGVAGVFFASKMAFVSPESFTFIESVMILCMVVLGGMGSIPGIILAAFLLIILPEAFRGFEDYRMLAFGLALVLMMIFRPQGLLGRVGR